MPLTTMVVPSTDKFTTIHAITHYADIESAGAPRNVTGYAKSPNRKVLY